MKKLIFAIVISLFLALPAWADSATVFAASSLTDALGAVAKAYQEKTGDQAKISFASSSVLARQIEQGAQADVFISANEAWMAQLKKHDQVIDESSADLLTNQLVLIAPKDAKLGEQKLDASADIVQWLHGGRLALGNPAHVPAGMYAKQGFESLGLWQSVQGHVARAANVRAALALVATGEAPLGVVYRTDAMAEPKVKIIAQFPAESHKPVVYPAAILTAAKNPAQAKAFYDFLFSDKALDIFEKYGFSPADR